MNYQPRISIFFFLIGLGFIGAFILLALGGEVKLVFLLLAVAGFILASVLKPKKSPVEPTRFAGLRQMNDRSHKRKQERLDKKHKKK
jgi:hypothetical protein